MDGDKAPGETARAEVSGSEEDLCCLQAFQDRDSGWAKVPPGPGFEGSSWHWNIISHVPMTTERAHHLSPQIGRREWAHGGAQPELKAQVNDHDVPMNSKEDTLTLQLTLLFWNALSLCPTAVGASREKAGGAVWYPCFSLRVADTTGSRGLQVPGGEGGEVRERRQHGEQDTVRRSGRMTLRERAGGNETVTF